GGTRSTAFLYLLYLWPGVFSSIVVVEFWRTVSDAYTIVEAKRVFGWVGAGGTAGTVAGAGTAVAIADWVPTSALLLAAAVCIAASVAVALGLERPRIELPDAPESAPSASPLATILRDPYLRGVAACLFLATVTATLVDFAFKGVLTRAVAPR